MTKTEQKLLDALRRSAGGWTTTTTKREYNAAISLKNKGLILVELNNFEDYKRYPGQRKRKVITTSVDCKLA